jgi:hypothetical protein
LNVEKISTLEKKDMPEQAMMGVYIGIGVFAVFVIIMIIVIPRQIRKGRQKGREYGENMAREIESRLGLKWNGGSDFVGKYKGYDVTLTKFLGSNTEKIREGVSDAVFGSRNPTSLHGQNTVYPALRVKLTKADANFPDVTLFQTSNFFMNNNEFWNNRWNGRIPDDAKLDLDADPLHKKANLYGDRASAEKWLNSAELRQLMSGWIYPDLRAERDEVRLELNHSNINQKWGHKKTSGTEWMIQGVEICVAAAKALQN